MPIWLDEAWSRERDRRASRRTLAEILWGQHALFLYVRLQDDVLDGQLEDRRLLLVADRFLLESLKSFQRVPGLGDAFWSFYRDQVRETVEAILEVGRLEKEAGRFTGSQLRLHARVGAVFKVGVRAVCCLHGRSRARAWLSRLQDQLAIVSQIGDDLEDLVPDLSGGRYTWVANTLLAARPAESLSADGRMRRLGEGLMRPERSAVIAAELTRRVRAAAAAVPKSAPRAIHDLLRKLSAAPAALERSLHEARVRWVFGDAVA